MKTNQNPNSITPTSTDAVINVTQNKGPVKAVCNCCNKTFFKIPYIEQDVCENCYRKAIKIFFSNKYDDLTVEEFKKAVKNDISEIGKESENKENVQPGIESDKQ